MPLTAHLSRLLAVLIALLLVAGACGGGDDSDGELSADEAAEQADEQTDDEEAAGDAEATTTTAAASGGGGGGGATGGSSSGAGTDGQAGSAGGSQSSVSPTQPGKYHYTVDGTSKGGAQSSDMADQTLEVKAPNGAVQVHVTTHDDGSSRTEMEFEFRSDGVYVRRISTSQQGLSKSFVFDPPALAAPASPAQGQKWSFQSTSEDGKMNLTAEFEVLETDSRITIGGQEISTYKLRSVITTSGDVESTTTETQWVSAEHRLIVKTEGSRSGIYQGAFPFSSEYRSQLDSLTPS